MAWECGLPTREEKRSQSLRGTGNEQLAKEPRRRTARAPRRPAASLVYISLPGNVGFQEFAASSERAGKGVRWGSELSLFRTSCPDLEVVLLLVARFCSPRSQSHLTRKPRHLKPDPPQAWISFTSCLLGSGTQMSGEHKGTVGSPGSPPPGMAHLPLLILELGLNGSRARIPRS